MIFDFTKDELELIAKLVEMNNLVLPVDLDLDYEASEKLRDAAMDFEVTRGLGADYLPTTEGETAISIADKLLAA